MKILLGLIARFLNLFIRTKENYWAFGAFKGQAYVEGSKYLMEYMLLHHPEYHCTFFTMNKSLCEELNAKGIPCAYNLSVRGIIKIAKCEAVFTTQTIADIRYAFRKKNRRYYYLVHGMPLKKSWKQLPKDYATRLMEGNGILARTKDKISWLLTLGYSYKDISFVSACSEFLAGFMKIEFDDSVKVKVLGMPRNDVLFDVKRMKNEKWIDGLDGKFIVTYMPTHRGYGTGEITPTPFVNRPDINQWLKEHNVVLLMKNHPNMISKMQTFIDTETIKDITKLGIDPQVCIYHSDALITDFSSVWMDYLLLKRPILFYIYDDFEHNDVGTYYDIRKANIGSFCYTEDELFELIKKCKNDTNNMVTDSSVLAKYHKYVDGNSCCRYYNEVNQDLKMMRYGVC